MYSLGLVSLCRKANSSHCGRLIRQGLSRGVWQPFPVLLALGPHVHPARFSEQVQLLLAAPWAWFVLAGAQKSSHLHCLGPGPTSKCCQSDLVRLHPPGPGSLMRKHENTAPQAVGPQSTTSPLYLLLMLFLSSHEPPECQYPWTNPVPSSSHQPFHKLGALLPKHRDTLDSVSTSWCVCVGAVLPWEGVVGRQH